MLDLNQMAEAATNADEGSWLELIDPVTNQTNGVRILLSGMDGKGWRDAKRKIDNRRLQAVARQGRRYKTTAEEAETDALELLSSCVLNWEGITEKGNDLPCTKANARRLLELAPWVREQVDDFVGDRSHFLPTLSND